MKKTWIVLAMAAALCAACNDTKDEPKCKEDTTICDNGQRMICTDGVYVAVNCPSNTVCANGACVTPSAQECLNGTLAAAQCFGANAIQYCSNGQVTVEQCPANYLCALNSAGAAYCAKDTTAPEHACELGSVRCSANDVRQLCQLGEDGKAKWADYACGTGTHCFQGACVECDNGKTACDPLDGSNDVVAKRCVNGKWETVATCNEDKGTICKAGNCYDKNACKTEGAIQCAAGEVVQTCTNSTWTTTDACAEGERCSLGKCQDGSLPVVGDSCNEKTADDVCVGNDVVYCDEGSYELYVCSGGAKCLNVPFEATNDSGKTETGVAVNCYDDSDKCDPKAEGLTVCLNTAMYGPALADAGCFKADGSDDYYKVPLYIQKLCPNGCDGDKCAEGGSGGGSGSGDDTAYDCSSEELQGGGTAGDSCKAKDPSKPVALCVPCNDQYIIGCGTSADVGKHLGQDKCLGGGSSSGDDTLYICNDSAFNETMTVGEYCQKNKPSTPTALCIPCSETAFFCATEADAGKHAGTQYCEDSSAQQTCDEVCAEYKGSSYKAYCQGNNADCFTSDPGGTWEYCGTAICS